jgi:hypothetical protein
MLPEPRLRPPGAPSRARPEPRPADFAPKSRPAFRAAPALGAHLARYSCYFAVIAHNLVDALTVYIRVVIII